MQGPGFSEILRIRGAWKQAISWYVGEHMNHKFKRKLEDCDCMKLSMKLSDCCNQECPENEYMSCSRDLGHEMPHFACGASGAHRIYEWDKWEISEILNAPARSTAGRARTSPVPYAGKALSISTTWRGTADSQICKSPARGEPAPAGLQEPTRFLGVWKNGILWR